MHCVLSFSMCYFVNKHDLRLLNVFYMVFLSNMPQIIANYTQVLKYVYIILELLKNSIALTGISGYVGQNMRKMLARINVPVVCLTRKHLRARKSEIMIITEPWSSPKALRALRKCSVMIHLAGVGHHVGGLGFSQNITLANSAIDACKNANIPKIIFTSGLGADSATSAYFTSKLEAERIIKKSHIPYIIFRASYIVGRGDALTRKISKLAKARLCIVPGDGKYIIQPIHIDDACSAILSLALSDRLANKTLDLVGPRKISYKNFVSMIVGNNAARSIPIQTALHDAVCNIHAPYDIDELAILLGSFEGDHDTLKKRTGIKFHSMNDMLKVCSLS